MATPRRSRGSAPSAISESYLLALRSSGNRAASPSCTRPTASTWMRLWGQLHACASTTSFRERSGDGMPIEVCLPQLGEATTAAKVGAWLKREGDAVLAGEPIVEVETDKTNVEIEAPA